MLAFDTVGALVARRFTINYAYAAPFSLVLYAGTGWLVAAEAGSWLAGAAGGAAAAATDATLGWRLARALGVRDPVEVDDRTERLTAASVTILGAVVGGLAGLVA